MRGRLIVTVGVLALALGLGLALTQAAGCRGTHCAYLATMQGSFPPAPTPAGPTPWVGEPCQEGVPEPVEGLQIWLWAPYQGSYYGILCSRLAVRGRYVAGFPVSVVHGTAMDLSSDNYNQSSRGSAISQIEISIASDYYFTVDQEVIVEASAQYLDQMYTARTSFVASPVLTPTPHP